jgi:hypothetical protein
MPGFGNDSTGQAVMFADNVDFSGNVIPTGAVTTNGQLLIGSTAAPHIRIGTLTSSDGSITWSVGAGTISGVVAGGTTSGKTITGNTGGPLNPAGGNWNIFGGTVAAGTTPVAANGVGSTLTLNVQTSQAIAATDATKIGLATFNSSDFSVDANGFVSIISCFFKLNDVTTATQTIAVQNGYVTDRGGGVNYTLPETANFGD